MDRFKMTAIAAATAKGNRRGDAAYAIGGQFAIECVRDGRVVWRDTAKNLVVDEGLNYALDVALSQATTKAMYVFLKGAGSAAAGDTLPSHAGWAELNSYTGNRKAFVDGGVSGKSVSNSASPAAFAVTGSMTVAGAGLCAAETGTADILFCVADFTGGNKSVENGDTLNVTYTATVADT